MKRWNYKTHDYDQYTPPVGKVLLYSENMDEPCVCAACGKEMTFGEGYTSLEIHNDAGFGFPVCCDCHDTEIMRRFNGGKEQ